MSTIKKRDLITLIAATVLAMAFGIGGTAVATDPPRCVTAIAGPASEAGSPSSEGPAGHFLPFPGRTLYFSLL